MRRLVWLAVLLAACATDPEEREVHFPRGEPVACERPDPRAALAVRGPGVMSSSFRLKGPGRAIETARLAGGVYLQIQHENCLKHSQVFRFYLPKTELLTEHPAAVYARVAGLLDAMAPAGRAGAALRELSTFLSLKAGKISKAPPLGVNLDIGEFQELIVTRAESAQSSTYGTILIVLYRLKV